MQESDSVVAALLSGLVGPDNVLKLENCMIRVRWKSSMNDEWISPL